MTYKFTIYFTLFFLLLSQNSLANPLEIDSLLQQGALEFKNGNYAKALKVNHKVLKLAEKLGICSKELDAKYHVARSYHFLDKRKIAI